MVARPMPTLTFADLIFTFQPGPMAQTEWVPTRLAIEHALREGLRDGEPWIFRDRTARDDDAKGSLN
jgi:hypothetical protein